mmetsp:Transcript_30838/g.77414  ORF Transcript_30838/g.77414 Transcript_30838/m.77414 type:complete len:698 (-) Transcript_30838:97-2190(-)|eukprot:CAMPEP_0174237312 /NCGR_PEP_ID=MMETSP0417-20130205/7845_1 /TAXON_ID=242541 /ORGANISM="Mayorella sp, Strain BSH-02190019" /LENGTH=697 /DNA_ID=CAMNT_0015316055 /DNA_START=22 /DNA_END=2115 /DNA_ORIENTATION=-
MSGWTVGTVGKVNRLQVQNRRGFGGGPKEEEGKEEWLNELANSVGETGLRSADQYGDSSSESESDSEPEVPASAPPSAPPPAPSAPQLDELPSLADSLSAGDMSVISSVGQLSTKPLHGMMLEFMNIDVDKQGKQVLTRSMDVRRQLHLGSIEEIQKKLELLIKAAYRSKDPRMQDLMALRRELVQMRRHLEVLELRESQRIPSVEQLKAAAERAGAVPAAAGTSAGVPTTSEQAASVAPSAPPAYMYSSSEESSSSSEDDEQAPDWDPTDIRNSVAGMILPVAQVEELRASLMIGGDASRGTDGVDGAGLGASTMDTASIGVLLPGAGAALYTNEPFECPICIDDVEADEAAILMCGHKLCEDCMEGYLTQKIMEADVLDIRCPDPTCNYQLTPQDVSELVPLATFDKYNEFAFLANLRSNPHSRWCLDPLCAEPVIADPDQDIVTCPKCSLNQCYHCRRPAHPGKVCAEVGDILASEEDKAFLDWVKDHSTEIKPCPRCNTSTEKTSGCNHITCLTCSHQWCWLCGLDYSSTHYSRGRCKGNQFSNKKTRAVRREKFAEKKEPVVEMPIVTDEDLSAEEIERRARRERRRARSRKNVDRAQNVAATSALVVGTVVGGAAIVAGGVAGVAVCAFAGPLGLPLFYAAGGIAVGISSGWKRRRRWRREKKRQLAGLTAEEDIYTPPAKGGKQLNWLDN